VQIADKNALGICLTRIQTKNPKCSPGRKLRFEFHISFKARRKYQFDETLFLSSGNVIFPNFRAVRVFVQKMNDKRDVIQFPEKTVRSGQINAMGLIDEILHYVIQIYREEKKSRVMTEALTRLNKEIGKKKVKEALESFTTEFPPVEVYSGEMDVPTYLKNETDGVSNQEIALEEMLMLWIANINPAFSPFMELFDDAVLEKETAYRQIFVALHTFFDEQPLFGPDNENLMDMLHSPAIAEPHSLSGQLDYIRKKWGLLLSKYLYRLLSSLDLIKEEERARFFVSGTAPVYEFGAGEFEPERFTPDKDWMPKVVVIAKSTYVWLDQLSRKYGRHIHRLDQVPDEELDQLARWGFTGLWLIGLWERSRASQRIKQLCGNPEAVASAYSLLEYEIANDLGGEEAFQNLRDRAWKRGIHMAGDMVPNHMGIDSRWLIEHPDWFISLDYSPFPSHTFNGANLSWDDRVGIYLEDHYYSRSDASVVFKRVDHWTGSTKYVYHGNDGTSMPWNDTAQLNYLNPEVREAVIQTILHVARKFSIIRFDAAMTLTKKHYQRLWFPAPGSGGDIPTRAEHGLTKSDFDQAMPEEFWREVVDRIAQELPDTLLLAEAFWLMEGYFVRTLGMHRVYNSAFMNMLKNEDNDKYRSSIKNVLEFNPEILKRFVNFMNNPDEETAVAQFGKGDKYFGVCTMMVTMPGLPMFGHGQIEGYTEKYGMEYRRAYWDEQPDQDLIHRHEQEIFPLMHKRHIFANVENFFLYDFFAPEGHVNENVFAYSNRDGDARGLVIYHNKYEQARGWIRVSAARSAKTGSGDELALQQNNLGEGLGLRYDDRYFVIFRDYITGLEFIRNSKGIHDNGLYAELGAYQFQVFLDFREVEDNAWHHYANLAAYLDGRGVPNMEEALRETFLRPIHRPFKELMNEDLLRRLLKSRPEKGKAPDAKGILNEIDGKLRNLLHEIKQFTNGTGNTDKTAEKLKKEFEIALQLGMLDKKIDCPGSRKYQTALKMIRKHLATDDSQWTNLFMWLFIHRLGEVVEPASFVEESSNGFNEWLLNKIVEDVVYRLGWAGGDVQRTVLLLKILLRHQQWWKISSGKKQLPGELLQKMLRDPDVQSWLQVNRYREVLWFNKESFDELVTWLLIMAMIDILQSGGLNKPEKICADVIKQYDIINKLVLAEKKSEFRIDKLLNAI